MDNVYINISKENEMIRDLFKDTGSTSFVTLEELFDKIEDLLGDIERLKDTIEELKKEKEEDVEVL